MGLQWYGVFYLLFSYASSSTLYPCQSLGGWVGGQSFETSIALRLASLFSIIAKNIFDELKNPPLTHPLTHPPIYLDETSSTILSFLGGAASLQQPRFGGSRYVSVSAMIETFFLGRYWGGEILDWSGWKILGWPGWEIFGGSRYVSVSAMIETFFQGRYWDGEKLDWSGWKILGVGKY